MSGDAKPAILPEKPCGSSRSSAPPEKSIVWPPPTVEANSRVEAPEIVSVPFPLTAPSRSSVPDETRTLPLLSSCGAMALVPLPSVFSNRPELEMSDDGELPSPIPLSPRMSQLPVEAIMSCARSPAWSPSVAGPLLRSPATTSFPDETVVAPNVEIASERPTGVRLHVQRVEVVEVVVRRSLPLQHQSIGRPARSAADRVAGERGAGLQRQRVRAGPGEFDRGDCPGNRARVGHRGAARRIALNEDAETCTGNRPARIIRDVTTLIEVCAHAICCASAVDGSIIRHCRRITGNEEAETCFRAADRSARDVGGCVACAVGDAASFRKKGPKVIPLDDTIVLQIAGTTFNRYTRSDGPREPLN